MPVAAHLIVPRCRAEGTECVEPRTGGMRHLAFARRSPRQRPGPQPQLREVPLDRRRFDSGRDDLQLTAAVQAVHVDRQTAARRQRRLMATA